MLCRINKKEMCGRLTHWLTHTSWIDVYLIKLAISYGSYNISYIAGNVLFITIAIEADKKLHSELKMQYLKIIVASYTFYAIFTTRI